MGTGRAALTQAMADNHIGQDQERAMFIQTETTPNPATLKFLPGETVLPSGTADFPTADSAAPSPLARRIFSVPGVAGVFLGSDFVTVTKTDAAIWDQIKPSILGGVMDHFQSGEPAIAGSPDWK